MAEVLTTLFHDLDLVPSDIAAGLLLLHLRMKRGREELRLRRVEPQNRRPITECPRSTANVLTSSPTPDAASRAEFSPSALSVPPSAACSPNIVTGTMNHLGSIMYKIKSNKLLLVVSYKVFYQLKGGIATCPLSRSLRLDESFRCSRVHEIRSGLLRLDVVFSRRVLEWTLHSEKRTRLLFLRQVFRRNHSLELNTELDSNFPERGLQDKLMTIVVTAIWPPSKR